MVHRLIGCVFLGAITVCGGGCSSDASEKDHKREVFRFVVTYHEYFAKHKKGPGNLQDLGTAASEFPKLSEQIRTGEFIVVWNAGLFENAADNGNYVLGYDRRVPEAGGWVLRGSGTFEKLTADVFKTIPKLPTKP